jgi:hypothetical protein
MKWHQLVYCIICGLLISFNASATVYYVDVNSANPTPPFTNWNTAATNIQDAVNVAVANDQILVTNGIYQYGGALNFGSNRVSVTKAINLQSVNGPSVTTIQGGRVPTAVRCVYLATGASLTGFTLTNGTTSSSGSFGAGVYCQTTAATVSNCLITGNQSWLVGGGAYYGTLNNCVIVGNTTGNTGVGSFNGGGAYSSILFNCSIISNTASGSASGSGGGIYSCTASNCVIANNLSDLTGGGASMGKLVNCALTNNAVVNTNSLNHSAEGGGAYMTYLTNCIVANNSVSGGAGGSIYGGGCGPTCFLVNCTIIGNSALGSSGTGGGVYNSTLYNCIVYNNTALTGSNWNSGSLYYCCTIPLPANGLKNITNTPLFVNQVGKDFHLQSNAPCINAGINAPISSTNDLDDNPRIVGGTVDLGAYEYQTPASVLSYAWAQQYGLPTDGSADFIDSDGDGLNNWQEWKAGTIPTNAASVLQLASPTNSVAGVKVTWQSVSGVTYYLQSSTNLAAVPAFTALQSNLVGQVGSTSYTDSTATNGGPYFYRVGVQ